MPTTKKNPFAMSCLAITGEDWTMPSSSTTLLHPVLPPPLLCTGTPTLTSSPTVASLVVSFAHNQGKFICYVMFAHPRGGLDHAIIKCNIASPCSTTTIAVHRDPHPGLQPYSGFSSRTILPGTLLQPCGSFVYTVQSKSLPG